MFPEAGGFDYYYGFHDGCVDYYSHRFYWGVPVRPNFPDLWRNREKIFEDGQYLTERFGDEASAFIAKPRRQQFFLYTALNAVHYPMHAPQKYVDRFPNLPKERQMYAAMLSAVDDAIGRVLAALKRSGQHADLFAGRQWRYHRKESWTEPADCDSEKKRSLPRFQVQYLWQGGHRSCHDRGHFPHDLWPDRGRAADRPHDQWS